MKRILIAIAMLGMTGGAYAAQFSALAVNAADLDASAAEALQSLQPEKEAAPSGAVNKLSLEEQRENFGALFQGLSGDKGAVQRPDAAAQPQQSGYKWADLKPKPKTALAGKVPPLQLAQDDEAARQRADAADKAKGANAATQGDRARSAIGTVVGGVAGAAVGGATFGIPGAIVGAAAGAAAGNKIAGNINAGKKQDAPKK
ncbi:MAG: hypothetical protein NTY45_08155 [Elusimicrobia bacterium]|nr:hypothetical protein [Elusimicrobiota bacterium]